MKPPEHVAGSPCSPDDPASPSSGWLCMDEKHAILNQKFMMDSKVLPFIFLGVRIQCNNFIKSAHIVYPISPDCNWYVAVVLRDHPQPSWVLLPVQTTQQGCGFSLVHPLSSGLALSSTLVLVSVSSQALLFLFFSWQTARVVWVDTQCAGVRSNKPTSLGQALSKSTPCSFCQTTV